MNSVFIDTINNKNNILILFVSKDIDYLNKVRKILNNKYDIAYIGVFGQQCQSSTGHFCNEIF